MRHWFDMSAAEQVAFREAETARWSGMTTEQRAAENAKDHVAYQAQCERERHTTGEKILAPIWDDIDWTAAMELNDLFEIVVLHKMEAQAAAAASLREKNDYTRDEAENDTRAYIAGCKNLAKGVLAGLAGACVGLEVAERAVERLYRSVGGGDASLVMAMIRNGICDPYVRGWPALHEAHHLFTDDELTAFRARYRRN